MPQEAVYLFKSARRESYRQENLHLLAAERGSIVEVAHNNMWVATEYLEDGSIPRGTPVYFVLTERPFSLFVPVRQGEIIDVRRDDLAVRVRVVLRSWVGLANHEVAEFTELVRSTNGGNAPGNKFLVPKRDNISLEPRYDEQEEEGWSQVIDNVLAMSKTSQMHPYADSVFFRPLGLQVKGELHPARRVPLSPGDSASLLLRFYNPHFTEERASDFTLRARPAEGTLNVQAPASFPPIGDVELGLEVLGGAPELLVDIGPAPAQHTSVTARFLTPEQALAKEVTPSTELARDELVHLYESVYRNAQFPSWENELELLADFERLIPGEARILEKKGLLLTQLGSEEAAFQVLRNLNPEILGDEARFALFRMWLHRDTNPARYVTALDLATNARFTRFLQELERLDPPMLARLLPELVGALPRDLLWDVIARVGGRLESPEAIADTARNLYVVSEDATSAFGYLSERRRALRLDHPEIIDALFDLAAAGARVDSDPELADDAARRISVLIERDELAAALAHLQRASRGFGRDQRDRLYHQIADRLVVKGHHEQATKVMVELAYAACMTGDLNQSTDAVRRARELTSATDAIERARGLLVRSNAIPDWLVEATEQVQRAWESFQPLAEWKQSEYERQKERTRTQLLNKTILVAGGTRKAEWEASIREFTGANLEWAEKYRDEGDNLDSVVAQIRNGRYAMVIYRWQKSGHEVQYKLKGECEKAGTPFIYTTTAGKRGIEEAVYEAIAASR